MSKFTSFMNNEKLQIMLKFVLLALLVALFISGEYFRKHGGHPLWYWIVLALVILLGSGLILTGIYVRNKKVKKSAEENNELE